MLDQMFTAENFRRIYDAENRKGVDLATRYFPTLNSFTLAVRNKAQDIRSLRKIESTLTSDDFNARLLALKDEFASLKAQKSEEIDSLMDDISQKVLKSSFKINLSQKTGPKGKPVFCIDAEPETFFVIKQLQRNIHRIYGVKQANRHDLVSQVRDMISNRFPFELVRTDISSFYETIDRKKLIEKLDSDQLLSPASKKYIKQVLASYGTISGTINGIPRGVGVSAYLAELYLRTIDNSIRAIPGLALYCRYVDDILAIFARPPEGNSTGSYKDQIITIFGKSDLTHNVTKTSEFNLANSNPVEFEYLGYLFNLTNKVLKIGPSTAKVDKYRSRMKAAFNAYEQQRPINPKIAYRELLSRIRFLTGNTRLSNSKAQAVTGIYFNNSISNDYSSFDQLDSELKLLVNGLKSTSLQKKLKKLKFATGFKERRYHSFSTRDLQMIVRAWKNV